jgi:hypothetical protein
MLCGERFNDRKVSIWKTTGAAATVFLCAEVAEIA